MTEQHARDIDLLTQAAIKQGHLQGLVAVRLHLLTKLRDLRAAHPYPHRTEYHSGQLDMLQILIHEVEAMEQEAQA